MIQHHQTLAINLGAEDHSYTIKIPGAISRARWMSKIIYSLKVVLFSNTDLTSNGINKDLLENLIRITNFCVLKYIPGWLKCPVATEAAQNDLNLLVKLFDYDTKDKECSKSVLEGISNHL